MTADKRLEALLNRAGQTISDLPTEYGERAETLATAFAAAYAWADAHGLEQRLEPVKYILHLTDVIDRMETALDNQVELHENLIDVIANADIPDGVSYEQFALVVDSIYKAIQTAQEG